MVIKQLLNLLLVLTLGAGLAWILIDDSQKKWVMAKFQQNMHTQTEDQTDNQTTKRKANHPKTDPVANTLEKLNKAINRVHPPNLNLTYNCIKPATKNVEEPTAKKIYSWVDESGRRHFSDKKVETNQQVEDIGNRYIGEKKYFELEVSSPTGGLSPLFKESLHRDVHAIYEYLTRELTLNHLRQVSLKLKVFSDNQRYQSYLQKHAPSLMGASGFYSAIRNEAVVLEQPESEWTKRIARHEATHVIMAGLYGQTPIWLNEGLAEVFSDYQNIALSREFQSPTWRLEELKALLIEGQLPDLKRFLTLSPKQWHASAPSVMYATSWAVSMFAIDNSKAKPFMLAILKHLSQEPCAKINGVQYVEDLYPGGFQAFEQDLLSWLVDKVSLR